jgi:hypothetical protein
MGLDRLIARLGGLITLLVAAGAAYGVVGFVLGFVPGVELEPDQNVPWPTILPAWLLVAFFLAALAVTVIQMPLLVVQRSRKRRLARELGVRAAEWLDGSAAREAGAMGLTLLRLTAFRAHARGPNAVELSWNPPLDEVDEMIVFRSPSAFATSAETPDGQVVVYSGDETGYDDSGLDDDRVYHYTAFARSREGGWSPPAWAWVTTPSAPLHKMFLGTLRTFRIPVPGSVR